MISGSPLSCNLHLPVRMNGGEHKDCQNNIQALRREGKGGHLFTNVMNKGMTHGAIVVWMVLYEGKKAGYIPNCFTVTQSIFPNGSSDTDLCSVFVLQ